MVKVLKISLYMSNEKNFSKNFDGLTKEESERLLELERSLELAKAKPKIENNFLSFVKYAWPDFIEGSHHKIINKNKNVSFSIVDFNQPLILTDEVKDSKQLKFKFEGYDSQ